jgi:uncharacterized membrane protein
MNAVHIHLLVVHLPVVLCPLVAVLLAIGLWKKNAALQKQGYAILIACAVAGTVAFYSGPSALEMLQNQLEEERSVVEDHAAIGRAAFIATLVAAALAIQALLQYAQEEPPARWLRVAILVLVLATCYLLAWSAHLGGQIRHPEIRESTFAIFPRLE